MPLMTIVFGTLSNSFADIVSGEITAEDFLKALLTFSLYFVYLGIAEFVGSYAMWIGFTLAGESMTNKIRHDLLSSLLQKGVAFLDESGTGEVINLLGCDADSLMDALSFKLGKVIAALTSVLVAFLIAFSRSWQLTLIVGSGLFAFAAAGGAGAFVISKSTTLASVHQTEAASIAQEAISGIACTVASSAEKLVSSKYRKSLEKAYRPAVYARISGEMMIATITSTATCLFSLAFWRGSRYYVNGQASFADVLIVLLAVLLGTASLGLVGPNIQAVLAGFSAARKMFATMMRPSSVDAGQDTGVELQSVRGAIRFENVDFAYPTRPDVKVLNSFSLHIPAGGTTAIVGASGCGKSTIIKLLQRFYDPLKGTIRLDGQRLSDLDLKDLRKYVAVVSQEPDLFNTSVYNNIRFGLLRSGRQLDEDQVHREIVAAAQAANIHEAILGMPDGYQTIVGERGARLSGGQRQRVAIARALVANPKILLLDEATSALDTVSESLIQEALASCADKDRTVIIIAHRLSTIKTADNVVVMADGEIVEQGDYENLIKRRGALYRLQNIQQPEKDVVGAHLAPLTADLAVADPESSTITLASSDTTANSVKPLLQTDFKSPSLHAGEEDAQNSDNRNLFGFLFDFNKPSWLQMGFGMCWAIVSGCGSTIQAYLFANAVTSFSTKSLKESKFLSTVDFWAGMLALLAAGQLVASAIRGTSLAICSERFLLQARTQAFDQMLRQEIAYFDEKGGQHLVLLLSTTLGQLNSLSVSQVAIFVVGFTGLISAIALSIAVDWKLGLVFTAMGPILLASGYLQGAFATQREQHSRALYHDAVVLATESIDCIGTVVSLGLEEDLLERFRSLLTSQARRAARKAHVACCVYALSQAAMYLCFTGCFYYGGRLLALKRTTMLDFFVCYTAIVTSTPSTGACFNMLPEIRKGLDACQQLLSLLSRKSAIDASSPAGTTVTGGSAEIATCGVDFRYPTRPDAVALQDITITASPGQFIALVGPSGSGKSTVLSLIERFYDPAFGSILHNGADIRTLNLSGYRKRMALITQQTALFSGTIRENIVLASQSATEDDIRKAMKMAAIDDFVDSLPEGLNTTVGHRGLSLSGGQRQRIAIARALLGDPTVLLLDEATSALDSTAEQLVQSAINAAARGRTTIAVAQRLSTVRHADRIYVIQSGRVVEGGTHEQLMHLDGVYASMILVQESVK
ncbi:multidrug resistance [Lecanosticta acicola]|uniref:Multidrug resistance n=1 Tax=Lecanosticta acicola TaxID=111012 RepID=A0AAI8Z9B2_9PEZI|nr:multidrug resistance [Lecanosticta acicola]